VEKKGDDTILDIKVLPDRACYALSHRGVAYEVSAITGLKKKAVEYPMPSVKNTRELLVRVEATDLCPRYMARVVENVTPKEMPWVAEHLSAVGQRSINPIVDGANLVMLDRGQPLHAFDADKVEGGIVVRMAKKGEKITTLDGREVVLDESVLVIADEKDPLAIAGIKGGKKAEVTTSTRNLILESASFDASYIRKTAERLGIKTDASKRFENGFSSALAGKGMEDFSAYLFEMDKESVFGETIDWYPEKLQVRKLQVRKEEINTKLGIEIAEKEIEDIFSRLKFSFEKEEGGWLITPPVFRADLLIPEDIAEEVGRLIGYDKIPSVLPPKSGDLLEIPKQFCYEWKVREILINAGFSEVMTSSFASHGDIVIEKPLAEDKSFARADLRGGFAVALQANSLHAPLFGADHARIFEIGRVFAEDGEHTALAIGSGGSKKNALAELTVVTKLLSERLGVPFAGEVKDGIFECSLDSIFEKLPEPKSWDITISSAQTEKYQPFSPYPFIVRDIALFVPAGTESDEVYKIILKEAGDCVARSWQFDTFEKDGKFSYAFRLVFQSYEKTLTDEEINKKMKRIQDALQAFGWQVR